MPLTNSIYFTFFPWEIQKRLEQTNVCHAFFHFVWKETTHKPLKVTAARTLFSGMYDIATTCFNECFLLYVIPDRCSFSWKFIVALRLFEVPCYCFLWSQCIAFCKVCILCFISTITQAWAYEKQGRTTITCLVMEFKGYRCAKNLTPPTK